MTFWSQPNSEGAGGIDRDGGVTVVNLGFKIIQKTFNNQQRLEAAMECRGGPRGGIDQCRPRGHVAQFMTGEGDDIGAVLGE